MRRGASALVADRNGLSGPWGKTAVEEKVKFLANLANLNFAKNYLWRTTRGDVVTIVL